MFNEEEIKLLEKLLLLRKNANTSRIKSESLKAEEEGRLARNKSKRSIACINGNKVIDSIEEKLKGLPVYSGMEAYHKKIKEEKWAKSRTLTATERAEVEKFLDSMSEAIAKMEDK